MRQILKPLTKKEALQKSVQIWKHLSKTGQEEKPKYAKVYFQKCPLCQYNIEQYDFLTCEECLVPNLNSCDSTSIYTDWYYAATPSEKKRTAKILLDLIQEQLDLLEPQKTQLSQK